MKTFLAAATLILVTASANAYTAGLKLTELFLPHHHAAANMAIWYPSTSSEAPKRYADNAVFNGVDAHIYGTLAVGLHPVVLFSHGMGGADRAQAWLGAALAERGTIVVMVNHPNSTRGDFDMSAGVAHWTRSQDLTVALDLLLIDPAFSSSIDMSRIMAAGFSYGGWTALSIGGTTSNHAGVVEACQAIRRMEACDLLLSDDVNVQGMDPLIWNANYADVRVTHVTAIDPALIWGLTPSNVANLMPSTLVIGLGRGESRMIATDFDRSGFSDLLGDRRIERLDPAYHFSAMPICKLKGEAILKEENDDPVCTDPPGSDRAAIHAKIVNLMAESLGDLNN